jgi:hypothetical protein
MTAEIKKRRFAEGVEVENPTDLALDITQITTDGDLVAGGSVGATTRLPTALLGDTAASIGSFTFVDGDVTVGSDTIGETSHPLSDGDTVYLTSTGTVPAGLTASTKYWVVESDTNTFKLSLTEDGDAIDITAAAGGGTHTVIYGGLVTARATETVSGVVKKPSSMIRLDTGNGHGSTNTKIRRFTNSVVTGTDITYADSAANGMSLTINVDGIYSISYTDGSNAASWFGISLNATGTDNIFATTAAQRLVSCENGAAIVGAENCSVTVRLSAGDVVRAHTDGDPTGTTDEVQLTITQIVVL